MKKGLVVIAIIVIAVAVGIQQGYINFSSEKKPGGESSAASGSTATGMAHGVPFTVEKATLKNGILTLRQGKDFFADQEFMIFTFLKKGETLAGKTFTVKPSDGFGAPHIHFKYRLAGKKLPKTEMFMDGYTMTLEFGTASGKKLPGTINLRLPDTMKSHVVGKFVADLK